MPNSAGYIVDLYLFIKQHSLLKGTFKLSSGMTASHYFDLKKTALHSKGARLLVTVLADKIKQMEEHNGKKFDTLATVGAGLTPILSALMLECGIEHGVIIHPKYKTFHGVRETVRGHLGNNVCLIDDVLTTGRAALKALDELKAANSACNVSFIAVLSRALFAEALVRERFENVTVVFNEGEFVYDA